jgi:hypothetical protein
MSVIPLASIAGRTSEVPNLPFSLVTKVLSGRGMTSSQSYLSEKLPLELLLSLLLEPSPVIRAGNGFSFSSRQSSPVGDCFLTIPGGVVLLNWPVMSRAISLDAPCFVMRGSGID